MLTPAIVLHEQTLNIAEDVTDDDLYEIPYTITYSASYGKDAPFINRLLYRCYNLQVAYSIWDQYTFHNNVLSDIAKELSIKYLPPYEEPLTLSLELYDGHDCAIASTVYNCEIIEY